MQNGRPKTVLVVEDDDAVRESVAEVLNQEGYRVVKAGNGSEALDYLRSSPPPSAILLDLMMPVMNGWEFLDEQQDHPELASIPTVIMSAYSVTYSPEVHYPGVIYLRKPIDLEELLNVVRLKTAS